MLDTKYHIRELETAILSLITKQAEKTQAEEKDLLGTISSLVRKHNDQNQDEQICLVKREKYMTLLTEVKIQNIFSDNQKALPTRPR